MKYLAAILLLTASLAYSQTTVIGGSNGGGSSTIADLTDVDETSRTEDDILKVNSGGDYINVNLLTAIGEDLTNGRVPFVSGGALADSSGLTWDGTYLTPTALQIGSNRARCTAVAGVVTCTDPTSVTGVSTWIFKGGAGQGAADMLTVVDGSGSERLKVNTSAVFMDATAHFSATTLAGARVSIGSGVTLGSTFGIRFNNGSSSAAGSADTSLFRGAAGRIDFGDGSANANGIVNAAGYQIAGGAPSGNVLRGNGTNFVSAQLNYSDIIGGTMTVQNAASDTLAIFQGGATEAGNVLEIKDVGGTVNAAITAGGVLAAVSAVVGPFGASRITGSAGFYVDIPEITPSGNPASNTLRLYASSADDKLYLRNSSGTDFEVAEAGGVGIAETIQFPLYNSGLALTASLDDGDRIWVRMPYSCDITSVEVTADVSGSLVVDLWKDTYANFPPTDADSITAAAPPTLSTAQKSQDATLTGWTTQVNAGDYITANIDSATTVTNALVSVQCTRD